MEKNKYAVVKAPPSLTDGSNSIATRRAFERGKIYKDVNTPPKVGDLVIVSTHEGPRPGFVGKKGDGLFITCIIANMDGHSGDYILGWSGGLQCWVRGDEV